MLKSFILLKLEMKILNLHTLVKKLYIMNQKHKQPLKIVPEIVLKHLQNIQKD